MDHYTLEQVGNGLRFQVVIDDPGSDMWLATAPPGRTSPVLRPNLMIPVRILEGPRAGEVGIGVASSDGRTLHGRRAFAPRGTPTRPPLTPRP